MKQSKVIIVISIALVIIAAIVFVTVKDISFMGAKALSIKGIENKVAEAGNINVSFEQKQLQYLNKVAEKTTAEEEYKSQKSKYDAISEDTISLIKDVTKDQKYNIEYLWVALGDYADDNNLRLIMLEPNQSATFNIASGDISIQKSGAANSTTEKAPAATTDNKGTSTTESSNIIINPTTDGSTIKILLIGSYQDIADFVFEVENDKSLKFKLDNISMQYAGKNYVLAQFDVLDMSVLLK